MLFKLSLKNIKKSIKDYAIYFFTIVLGVAIFYVFNAIDSQTVMMNVSSSTKEIIKLMTNMLSGVSVFVSFILGFLVIYASRFLIKRRNKEFGIYMTLGMSKQKISMILFLETLIIGIISLVVGAGLGVLLSQFMSVLVANMFDADMTNYTFTFSKSAIMKTLIYFSIIYLIVMIFNTFVITKCKLIDLLHGAKKNETVKMKNPVLSILVFLGASIALGYAYWKVTAGFNTLNTADKIFPPIIIGCVSTFLIFWSASGLILKIFQNMKNVYYKDLNSFTLRQFSSKINTTVFSMTIICLMLFVTICVLSASLTVKNSLDKNTDELAPADIQLEKIITDENNLNIIEYINSQNVNIDDYLREYVTVDIYHLDNITLASTLGSKLEIAKKNFPLIQSNTKEDIMKISDYNRLSTILKEDKYTLNDDEYIIIADFDGIINIRNMALSNNENINIQGTNLKPKYTSVKNGFIELSSQHLNGGVIIVPDSVLDNATPSSNILTGNYNVSSKKDKRILEEKLINALPNKDKILTGNTRIDIQDASLGLGSLITFIGLYLGIIFLISSAAILALKELSESSDNRLRFKMIRALGADEKVINRALFKQILIFFMCPLVLAIIHSVFGMIFSVKILEILGTNELVPSLIMTATFLIIIYGGYFLITYGCSKNIIKEN